MSSTGHSQQRQQIYYESRPHHSQRLGVGTSMMDHQIVVVSGSSTSCVADYRTSCECPSCESKINLMPMGHSTPSLADHEQQLYPYSMGPADDDDDGIVHEFTTESGERHVVIMTKDEQEQDGISAQERIRRQKLSEAARNRYALLSEEEKRAVTERRVIMRQRRKQKEREMEELEAILRASNDITDDLVPLDEEVVRRKRAKMSRYQSMSIEERREYNQKRRLRQLGLPENINEVDPGKMDHIKSHISEVNARKAEAARLRYHRMLPEERKAYNRRRTESFRKRRVEEEKLLSTPAGQITPEALEKAQGIMLRNAKRAEQARLRYQKKQQEKGIVPRRQRRPKVEQHQTDIGEPNLDQILDTIERDVVRKTVEARQALVRMQQNETKKEEPIYEAEQQFVSTIDGAGPAQIIQTPINISSQPAHGQNIVQYVQVPSQNGYILSENKFVPVEPHSSHAYSLEPGSKFERSGGSSNYYPVSIIQHESPQRHSHQLQTVNQPTRIEIVQPAIIATTQGGNFDHVIPSGTSGHIIHYTTQPQAQQYTIQLDQPISQHRTVASTSRVHSQSGNISAVDERVLLQKAKRAERARRRYHEMSAEARHEFNAKRAHSLKMARLRDEELCRLGDELSLKGDEPNQNLRIAIEQARMRRAKRAEAARIKYQKMTSEQRKAHNAMRDAQRRQRKREMEDTVVKQH